MNALSVAIEDHIAVVTLDRPPINALVKETYREIRQVFSTLGEIEGVRVALLRAGGEFFCPGNDVREFQAISGSEEARAYARMVRDAMVSIYDCEVPVIAAVHGHALGAGMAIAACADVVVAAESAQFGIPEIKVGVIGAAGFLALLVPEKVVRYMSLSGRPISAAEVKAYGGVQELAPAGEVFDTAMRVAGDLAGRGPTALRYFKEAMNINQDARLAEKYDIETGFTGRYVGTTESKEAIAAFLENRRPRFD